MKTDLKNVDKIIKDIEDKKTTLGKLIPFIIFLSIMIPGIYVGGWFFLLKSIINCILAIIGKTVTVSLVAISIIKIIFGCYILVMFAFSSVDIAIVFDKSINRKNKEKN